MTFVETRAKRFRLLHLGVFVIEGLSPDPNLARSYLAH